MSPGFPDWFVRFSLPLLLGICFLSPGVFFGPQLTAQPAEQEESSTPPTVQSIQFVGLNRYDPSILHSKMQTEVGRPFREDVLREDIRRLYELGFVTRVRWSTESVDGGVRLTLRVSENPRIQEVRLKGFEEFSTFRIKKELDITDSETMDSYMLEQDKKTIKKKYKDKGFHFVQVTDRKLEGEQGMILIIEVIEGPQVFVEEITINGARNFDPDTLIDEMDSEPGWLFGWTQFKKKTLEKDLEKIRSFYRDYGYLDAEVHLEDLEFSPGKQYVYPTIRVEEGPQYGIKSIEFNGNTLFDRKRLMKEIRLKPGEPFLLKEMRSDQRSIKNIYGRKAYIDTEVDWHHEVIPNENNVHLVFQITEHGTTEAGRIDITGNTKTKEHVIRRRIDILPGKPVDLVKLRKSVRSLRSTRYFSDVSVNRTSTEEDPGVNDFTFSVKEKSTGRIRLGGGFSSNIGLIGIFQISQRNFDISRLPSSFSEIIQGEAFAGGGQRLDITLKPGAERSEYSVKFREPYLLDQPLGMDVEGRIRDQIFDDFEERREGGELGFDYRFEDWSVQNDFNWRNITITDVESGSPTDIRNIEGDHVLYSTTPGFTINKRDNNLNTTSGYLFSSSYQYTAGDFDFGKWNADLRTYFPLYRDPISGNHVLSLRTRYGLISSFNESKDTPSFERFYAGGARTIRGFDFRTISPRIGEVEVGGDARWIGNLEYTMPLIRDRIGGRRRDFLRGALFVDAGTVGRDAGELDKNVRVSAGFGIRFKLPGMGQRPFALDFGFPIEEVDGDDTQVISFDIGATF